MINSLSAPLGAIHPWIRQNNTIPLPYGWLICDGSTVVDSESSFNGKAIPDFRAKFPRGHNSLNNSNFSSDTIYYAGGTIPAGGANTNNLYHAHTTPGHTHSWGPVTSTASADFRSALYWYGQNGVYSHTHNLSGGASTSTSPGTGFSLSTSTENRPAFLDLVKIIRVK